MADFSKAIDFVLKWEAGLVDNSLDPGGLTNRGITIGTFKTWAKSILGIDPTEDNLRHLTVDQAKAIYKTAFWDKIRASEINNQDLALIVFDFYVNATSVAIPLLQQLLNKDFGKSTVSVDGAIGPKTLSAVNAVNSDSLYQKYKNARVDYYNYRANNLPPGNPLYLFFQGLGIKPREDQKIFLKGWLNRTLAFIDKKKV